MTKTSISERCAMRTGADRETCCCGDQNDLRACSTSGARYLNLANVEVQQRAGLVDRRRPDHCEINTKLFDLLNRDRPDNAAVALPHRSAGEKDFDGAASVQLACDMEVVGDDQETGMSRKRFRDLFRRCADVDEQRRIVRDEPRRRFSNQSLLVMRNELPGFIGQIFNSARQSRLHEREPQPSSLSSLRSRHMVCKATLNWAARSSTATSRLAKMITAIALVTREAGADMRFKR